VAVASSNPQARTPTGHHAYPPNAVVALRRRAPLHGPPKSPVEGNASHQPRCAEGRGGPPQPTLMNGRSLGWLSPGDHGDPRSHY
jgi:hypothetical protein